jgi:hypothetical protein
MVTVVKCAAILAVGSHNYRIHCTRLSSNQRRTHERRPSVSGYAAINIFDSIASSPTGSGSPGDSAEVAQDRANHGNRCKAIPSGPG